MKSTMFSLKVSDFWKSLIMAVGTPILYWLQTLIPGWNIPPELKAAISAGITYIVKNFLSDDTKAAVKTVNEAGAKVVPKDAKIVSVILVLLGFSFCGYSQSNFFQPIHKIQKPSVVQQSIMQNGRRFAIVTPDATTGDTIFWALRPIVSSATIFVDGTVEVAAGGGFSYQNISQRYSDNRNYVNYAISALVMAGGSVIPKSPSDVEKLGVMVSALNNTVGIGWALSHRKYLPDPINPDLPVKKYWKGGFMVVWSYNFNN